MTHSRSHIQSLSDEALVVAVKAAAGREREATARLIALLAEFDERRAIVRKLPARRSAEPAAVVSAGPPRAPSAETPASARTIAPHPESSPAKLNTPAAAPRPVVAPLSAEHYRVQFTVSRETHDKLRRAQDLLRHSVPDGDPAAIFDRALTLLLEHLGKTMLGATRRPRPARAGAKRSRHTPRGVRREVWARDNGQCAFVGAEGHRCAERGCLEFHHVVPYADGGAATVEGLELRCRAHNQHEAVLWDGGGGWVREAGARYAASHDPSTPS